VVLRRFDRRASDRYIPGAITRRFSGASVPCGAVARRNSATASPRQSALVAGEPAVPAAVPAIVPPRLVNIGPAGKRRHSRGNWTPRRSYRWCWPRNHLELPEPHDLGAGFGLSRLRGGNGYQPCGCCRGTGAGTGVGGAGEHRSAQCHHAQCRGESPSGPGPSTVASQSHSPTSTLTAVPSGTTRPRAGPGPGSPSGSTAGVGPRGASCADHVPRKPDSPALAAEMPLAQSGDNLAESPCGREHDVPQQCGVAESGNGRVRSDLCGTRNPPPSDQIPRRTSRSKYRHGRSRSVRDHRRTGQTRTSAPILPTTPDDQPPDDPGLILLTVAEIKRPFTSPPTAPAPSQAPALGLVATAPPSTCEMVSLPHPTTPPTSANMTRPRRGSPMTGGVTIRHPRSGSGPPLSLCSRLRRVLSMRWCNPTR
jgi:hypothetical protein